MSETVPEKDFGEVQDQELLYAPLTYGPIVTENEGRWFNLEDKAIVWTDDRDGAGISWLSQTDENQRIWKHFSAAKHFDFAAGTAYQLALASVEGAEETEQSGKLSGAVEAVEALADQENTRA